MRYFSLLLISLSTASAALAQSTPPTTMTPSADADVVAIGYEGRGDYAKSRKAELERARKNAAMPAKKPVAPAFDDTETAPAAPATIDAGKTPPMAAGLAAAVGNSAAIAQAVGVVEPAATPATAPEPVVQAAAPAPAPAATPAAKVAPVMRTDNALAGDSKLLPAPAPAAVPATAAKRNMNAPARSNAMPLMPGARQ